MLNIVFDWSIVYFLSFWFGLAGHEPSPYFVAVVYRSVVQFVDMGNRVIDCVAKSVLHKRSQTKNEASKFGTQTFACISYVGDSS